MKKFLAFAASLFFVLSVVLGCGSKQGAAPARQPAATTSVPQGTMVTTKQGVRVTVEQGRAYTDKDHVAAYIHAYKSLPPNYITKAQAQKLGWKQKGTLDKVAPGKSIGGDLFRNYEKTLPDRKTACGRNVTSTTCEGTGTRNGSVSPTMVSSIIRDPITGILCSCSRRRR